MDIIRSKVTSSYLHNQMWTQQSDIIRNIFLTELSRDFRTQEQHHHRSPPILLYGLH
jgi:hypothetical protein